MTIVTPTILSSGKVMNPTFELVSIDVVKEVNQIPYASLTLLDGSSARQKFAVSDDDFFEPGKEIEIKLRYEGQPGSEVSVFKGLVVKQVVEANRDNTQLTIELKDPALKLTQGRKSAVYTQKTDRDIISQLISNGGLRKGELAATQPVYPELVQYYCTDWDFILSRADTYGLLVVAHEGEISVKQISVSGQPKHTFEFGINEVYNFEIEVDANHQYAVVQSIAWDVKAQKLTQASKAKNFTLPQGNLDAIKLAKAVGGDLEVLSDPVSLDPKALQAWADGIMIKSRMSMIRGRISVPGFGNANCLDVMEVAGVGNRFNGKTVITGVRHRVGLNSWQTDVQFGISAKRFAARQNVMDAPAAGLLPAVHGLQIGIVAAFEDDPTKEFRVKVILPGVDEKKGAVWARLASLDAGKERGFFFRPEKDDEVVVGFFNDDPGQAVILGAMYGSKNAPPSTMSKLSQDNLQKGIVTRKGTILGFKDDEKPSVYIQTPGKNKILLDDDGQLIQMVDQHGNTIKMSQDGIEIKSAKNLKIEASGNVEIKGIQVDVK